MSPSSQPLPGARLCALAARGCDLERLTSAQGLAEHGVDELGERGGAVGAGGAGHVGNVRAVERAGE